MFSPTRGAVCAPRSLARSTPVLAEQVRNAFQARGVSDRDEAPASLHELTLLAFGGDSPKERERLRRRALREIVLPCAGALLESIGPEGNVANRVTGPPTADTSENFNAIRLGRTSLSQRFCGLAFSEIIGAPCRGPSQGESVFPSSSLSTTTHKFDSTDYCKRSPTVCSSRYATPTRWR